ncbi:hypothetical protein [Aureimonas sp. SK2]|uniref:hypothetical protein n=1 Tax=Aureimonas sp. SK2 TaxID=3015992 RepID=UPI0024442B2E|nr:hypothetical protein [Aureimonas sp. SK2]
MINVTNVSERSTTLPQKGKGSVEILPGETKSVQIEADNPHVVAKLAIGTIQIEGEKKPEPAPGGRKPAGESGAGSKPD